jgi:hypothetical protein
MMNTFNVISIGKKELFHEGLKKLGLKPYVYSNITTHCQNFADDVTTSFP